MTERNFGNKSLESLQEKIAGQFGSGAPKSPLLKGQKLTREAEMLTGAAPVSPAVPGPPPPPQFSPQELPKYNPPQRQAEAIEQENSSSLTFQAPTIELQLPSGTVIYGDMIPEGKLLIKALEQPEIDILNTDHLTKKGEAFDMAIDKCIIKPNVSSSNLLSGDRIYLLFKLFSLSRGTSKYEFTETCPSCRNKNKVSIDLNEVPVKNVNLEYNSFIIDKLPISGRSVRYHLLTGNDRKLIENKIRTIMQSTAASKLIDTTAREILIACIDEVSGVPQEMIREFVKHLVYGDSVRIREHMDENTPGINPIYDFSCVHCDYDEQRVIPITAAFFSMKNV